jgi:hypothetical protein
MVDLAFWKLVLLGSVFTTKEVIMSIKQFLSASIFAALLTPLIATAGGIDSPPIYESRTQTTGYVGLQWLLGEKEQSAVPNVVVGARYTKTNTSNRVSGADLSLTYDFSKSQVGSVRLGYLGGKCDLLGTAGIGYDYANKAMLGYLGAIGPYSKVFGQIGGQGFGLGLEVNTQDCAKDAIPVDTPEP